ncbi:hypothetical protein EZV62_003288 [Acer yangbiense]|uniref:Uncharacterized protein n=1 Tax=Acer yangbiense TaxID=1000413 RepID=A0A5C7IGH7_9ROSI|nr:hypothetical protein EZV62_003288 [Acer yangbiense]
MDEQLVSPIVEILLRKLQYLRKQKVPLGRDGGDNIELERLETILSSIQVVLLDAEKLQCYYLNLRSWLKKLKDACYDAEDTLEELEIEALHDRQLKKDQSTRSKAGKRDIDKEDIIKLLMQNDDLDVYENNIQISGPSDHGFNNITLTQFWMAHGLLQSDDENHEEPESIGMRYIDELRRRGLFQDFEHNFDFISFKMHQLVHDLATQMAPNDCFIMDSGEAYNSSHKTYRHLSVVEAGLVQKKLFGNKMIRSILFFEMFRPSQSLIRSCISEHPNLRVLDFRNSDMEVLPESTGKLKHLRYLNLTKNIRIKRLPKSIFMLTSLETLLLGGCKVLEELPRDISRLVNLRMLVFSSKQSSLPEKGIGCLTSLRRLGIGSCYNLEYLFEDIGSLKALQTLIIGDCPKLVSLPPGVKDLSSLENLMLSDSEKSSKCNLQSIKPHLRMLCIDGLPEFNELPQLLLQCSANSLRWLAIKNCPNFKGLPAETLPILKSLEVLEISNCPKFASLPEDMHGLTAMRELKVRDCPDLSKRCKRDTGEDWTKISHIPKIEIHDNPKNK